MRIEGLKRMLRTLPGVFPSHPTSRETSPERRRRLMEEQLTVMSEHSGDIFRWTEAAEEIMINRLAKGVNTCREISSHRRVHENSL